MGLIIGFTGPARGGKSTCAHELENVYGFKYLSLSDTLREISNSNDRKILQDLGDKLREDRGPDILAVLTAKKIKESGGKFFAVDSIRHPAEINFIKKNLDGIVIGVNAPLEKIWSNMQSDKQKRKERGDPETYEEFLEMMRRENGKPGSTTMQVTECLKLAFPVIRNTGTVEELKRDAIEVFRSLGIENAIRRERE